MKHYTNILAFGLCLLIASACHVTKNSAEVTPPVSPTNKTEQKKPAPKPAVRSNIPLATE